MKKNFECRSRMSTLKLPHKRMLFSAAFESINRFCSSCRNLLRRSDGGRYKMQIKCLSVFSLKEITIISTSLLIVCVSTCAPFITNAAISSPFFSGLLRVTFFLVTIKVV